MTKFIDLSDKRFGKLVVKSRNGKSKNGEQLWLCECDCNNMTTVRAYSLKNNLTKSCGCLRAEQAKSINKSHGMSGKRLYNIWLNMRARCYSDNSISYSNYGKRGIIICNEWRNDFLEFRDWALSNGYDDNLSIERLDNNGNYCPENCKWATEQEQQNNKRNNHVLTHDGKTKTMMEWAKLTGLPYCTIKQRINKLGWSAEKSLTTPKQKRPIPVVST